MSDAGQGRSHVIDKQVLAQPTVAAFSMRDYRPEMSRQAGLRTVIERGTPLKQFKSANGVIQRKPVSQEKFDQIIDWLKRTGLIKNPFLGSWYRQIIQPDYDFGNDPGVFALSFLCNELYMGMDKEVEQRVIADTLSAKPATIHDFAAIYKMYCHIYQRSKFEAVAAELTKPLPPPAKPGPPPATRTFTPKVERPKKVGGLSFTAFGGTPLKPTLQVAPPVNEASKIIEIEAPKTGKKTSIPVISHPRLTKVQVFLQTKRIDEIPIFGDVFKLNILDDSPIVQFWDIAIDHITKFSLAPRILTPAIVFAMQGKSYTECRISVPLFIASFDRAVAALKKPMNSKVVSKTQERMKKLLRCAGVPWADQSGTFVKAHSSQEGKGENLHQGYDPCESHRLFYYIDDYRCMDAIRTAAAKGKLFFPSPLDAINHLVKHGTAYKQNTTKQPGKVMGDEFSIPHLLDVYMRQANAFIAHPNSLVPFQEVDVTLGRFAYAFEDATFKAIVTCNPDGSDPRIATFFPKEEYNMVNDFIPVF